MALQIRRGLEADRTSITPLVGEFLYVTDTGKVYIGDGTTAGGTVVTGDVINDTSPQLGGDLDLNGNDIIGTGNINIDGTITATGNINLGDTSGDNINVAGSITTSLIPRIDSTVDVGSLSLRWRNGYFTGLSVDGEIDAVSYNGNIIADDSTVAYDASTGNIIAGDITANSLTVGVLNLDAVTADVTGSLFADDSSILVDAINKTFFGTEFQGGFVGDIFAADGTKIFDNGTDGTDARFTGDITAVDTSKIVDVNTKVVTGTFNGTLQGNVTGNVTGDVAGNVVGDVTGSIFADDSTLIVDAINNSIFATSITSTNLTSTTVATASIAPPTSDTLRVNSALTGQTILQVEGEDTASALVLKLNSASDLSGSPAATGRIAFTKDDANGLSTTSIIAGSEGYIAMSVDAGATFTDPSTFLFWTGSNLGVGTNNPGDTLDVRGSGTFTGTINAASFKGSLVADDSTILVDAINGSLLVANIDVVGATGTPSVGAGDLANVNEWLQVTVNGNTRYIPLYA